MSEDELKKMLADVDEDGTGEIEFAEFCKLMGVDSKGAKPLKAEPKVLFVCMCMCICVCVCVCVYVYVHVHT